MHLSWIGVVVGALLLAAVAAGLLVAGDIPGSERLPDDAAPAASCGHRLEVGGADAAGVVEYCARGAIDDAGVPVQRLVLVVHGDRRDADRYYARTAGAASSAGAGATFIVAPRFPTRDDVEEDDQEEGAREGLLYWSDGGWKQGDGSRGPVDGVSAFAAVDALLAAVAARHPELREVVVAGHSAGGQFVNRYAAASPLPDRLEPRGISVRFVVANPSSYLYLDGTRPRRGSVDEFERPAEEERDECPEYDDYKYGLADPNDYVDRHGTRESIRERYLSRRVIYLLGGDDRDPEGDRLDRTCAAELQGEHRLERGRAYFNHLGDVGGSSVYRRHTLEVLPDVTHDADAVFGSEPGRRALFG